MATESTKSELLSRAEVAGIAPNEMNMKGKVDVLVEDGKLEVTLPVPEGN